MPFSADDFVDLNKLLQRLWEELTSVADLGSHPLAYCVLGTVDDGEVAQRGVILRAVNQPTLLFHTHRRSPKIEQLRQHPHCSVLTYDWNQGIQITMRGTAEVHTDDAVADSLWDAARVSSRRAYLAPHTPSDLSPQPSPNLPPELVGKLPTEEQTLPGRANFSVIAFECESIDILRLDQSGNRRAKFWHSPTGWEMSWLYP